MAKRPILPPEVLARGIVVRKVLLKADDVVDASRGMLGDDTHVRHLELHVLPVRMLGVVDEGVAEAVNPAPPVEEDVLVGREVIVLKGFTQVEPEVAVGLPKRHTIQ